MLLQKLQNPDYYLIATEFLIILRMTIQFCFDKGIFIIPRKYSKCTKGSTKYRQGCKTYYYSKKNYRKEISICKGTFFKKSKV